MTRSGTFRHLIEDRFAPKKCRPPQYSVADLSYDTGAATLIQAYIDGGVLSQDHWHDLGHITYATLYKCRYLVSCDETHVARKRTQTRVEKINMALRYFVPQILTPSKLLEELQ